MVNIITKHIFKRNYYGSWTKSHGRPPFFTAGEAVINMAYRGSSGVFNDFRSIEDAKKMLIRKFLAQEPYTQHYAPIAYTHHAMELIDKLVSGEILEVRVYENGSYKITPAEVRKV